MTVPCARLHAVSVWAGLQKPGAACWHPLEEAAPDWPRLEGCRGQGAKASVRLRSQEVRGLIWRKSRWGFPKGKVDRQEKRKADGPRQSLPIALHENRSDDRQWI